jgi:hypothetical protein
VQIRLTVLGPRSGGQGGEAHRHASDVLVTAPDGTTLGTVAGALAGSVGLRQGARGGRAPTHVHLYAGDRRLDDQAMLGHPPLIEGAVLAVDGPAPVADRPDDPEVRAELHVVGGPDAGGVHLLHPGRVRLGRAAEADVPLDDPDVSRLHLVVEVGRDGRCSVADQGSTNGTTLDGSPVGAEPYPVPGPDALIRAGETTLRVTPLQPAPAAGEFEPPPTGAGAPIPDGRGRLSLPAQTRAEHPYGAGPGARTADAPADGPVGTGWRRSAAAGPRTEGAAEPAGPTAAPASADPGGRRSDRDTPISGTPSSLAPRPGDDPDGPAHGPEADPRDGPADGPAAPGRPPRAPRPRPSIHPITAARARRFLTRSRNAFSGREPFPPLPTLSRRPAAKAGGRPGSGSSGPGGAESTALAAVRRAAELRDRWPDPATVLLTALGPGPRLWERDPAHPDALTLRLGSTAPGAAGVPPTAVDLRRVGSLGLAGPRPRLSALARAAVAQLATWHGPSVLELVLVAADAERPLQDRSEEWSWLYWLPHLRPRQDQPCRLLVGLDADQAVARLGELTARTDAGQVRGPLSVLVVDGDPGSAEAADAVERLLAVGPEAGVFPIVLAEHPSALPPGLGSVAAIGGEVGTLLRLDAPSLSLPSAGVELAADMASAEWAERLARALAPLREPAGASAGGRGRAGGPLPSSVRLLDLLELESVTPAKLSARWAAVPPTADAVTAVLGADREGVPCSIDLADSGGMPGAAGHVLIAGDRGAGKTELLRTLIASLAVAEGPERLRVTILEGLEGRSAPAGGGLGSCTELPQVTECRRVGGPADAGLAADALLDELALREQQFAGRGFAARYAEHALALLRGGGADAGLPSPPPRLLVVVDDLELLLRADGEGGNGSAAQALATLALRGARVGIHLVVATCAPEALAGTALDEAAQLRIALRLEDPGAARALLHVEDAAGIGADRPGRAYVRYPDGGVTAFQSALVSGRIPRTATLRPTVVALDWPEMGAPPTRRPVRELGNGPTDLALLASALGRAAAPVAR